MLPLIAISGTPGTGKTAVAKLLATQLTATLLELNQIIKEQQFLLGKDADRDTFIADIDRLQDYLRKLLGASKGRYIIVGHFADEAPDELLEVLVVLRCNPVDLTHRLQTRGWSQEKIIENIQAEILGECTTQALLRHPRHKVFEIDTTKSSSEEVVRTIKTILTGKGEKFSAGTITWLRILDPRLLHQIMEEGILPSKPQKA